MDIDREIGQVAEGKVFDFKTVDNIRTDFLKTFEFGSIKQLIKTVSHEFSAVCPFSGLPDIAMLEIIYKPEGGLCIELKSLKYYLVSFRDVGIYQEAATKKIYDDLKKALCTDSISVKTVYNTRGGFDTECLEGTV